MRIALSRIPLLVLALVSVAGPAAAQQALSLHLGYNALLSEGSRSTDDVIVANQEILSLSVSDFNSAVFGAEWTSGLGEYLEAGVSVGSAARTVSSVYSALVRPSGREINQESHLRVTPVAATVRVLPFGRNTTVQPYVGGGVGLFTYRYEEAGDFVDFRDRSIYTDSYSASGSRVGLVLVGGLRVPAGDRFALGGEVRYHRAEAPLSDDFLGSRLDLGAVQYLGVLQIRF